MKALPSSPSELLVLKCLKDCKRAVYARGLCKEHYDKARRTSKLSRYPKQIAKRNACSVPGCSDVSKVRGLCIRHYHKARHAGETGGLLCRSPECTRYSSAKGFCDNHYRELRRNDPLSRRCVEPGCNNAQETKKRCNTHYKKLNSVDMRRAKCSHRKCPNRATQKGVCLKHYMHIPAQRARKRKDFHDTRARGDTDREALILLLCAVRCLYCGKKSNVEIEHIVAVGPYNGTNVWWNLVPACTECNHGIGGKGVRVPGLWLAGKKLANGKVFEGLSAENESTLLLLEQEHQTAVATKAAASPAPWWSIWARMGLPLDLETHKRNSWNSAEDDAEEVI